MGVKCFDVYRTTQDSSSLGTVVIGLVFTRKYKGLASGLVRNYLKAQ